MLLGLMYIAWLFFLKHFLSICMLKDKYLYDYKAFWNSMVNVHPSLHHRTILILQLKKFYEMTF